MNNIPKKLRDDMAADPYYERCCVTGTLAKDSKVEWHHNLIYAGRQVQEKWCILPLAKEVHDRANHTEVREKLDWIMLNRATDEQLHLYSKVTNLLRRREQLNQKYGPYRPKTPQR